MKKDKHKTIYLNQLVRSMTGFRTYKNSKLLIGKHSRKKTNYMITIKIQIRCHDLQPHT